MMCNYMIKCAEVIVTVGPKFISEFRDLFGAIAGCEVEDDVGCVKMVFTTRA